MRAVAVVLLGFALAGCGLNSFLYQGALSGARPIGARRQLEVGVPLTSELTSAQGRIEFEFEVALGVTYEITLTASDPASDFLFDLWESQGDGTSATIITGVQSTSFTSSRSGFAYFIEVESPSGSTGGFTLSVEVVP